MLSDDCTSDPSMVLIETGVVPLDATGDPRQSMICGMASWGRMHAAQKEQAGPEAPVQQDPHLVADGVARCLRREDFSWRSAYTSGWKSRSQTMAGPALFKKHIEGTCAC